MSSRITIAGLTLLSVIMLGLAVSLPTASIITADEHVEIAIPKSQPNRYTQAFVHAALDRYDADGRQATIDYYNTMESVDGEWYVFIADEDGVIVSHATVPENIGMALDGPLGTDINGYDFGADMLSATDSGKWVSYTYLNPTHDDAQERKHSWVIKRDGLLFGSGWYEKLEPVATTNELDIFGDLLLGDGMDDFGDEQDGAGLATLLLLSTLFGTGLDAGASPGDGDGDDWRRGLAIVAFILSLLALEDSDSYSATDDVSAENDPDLYTKAFVDDAVQMYKRQGRQATIDYYNTMESVDGEWYVYILDENNVVVSHPTLPENVGQSILGPSGTDINGYEFGRVIAAASEQGRWVSYTYLNPARGNIQEQKHAWVVRYDGLIFGSGWYERVEPTKRQPAAYTRSFVQDALDRYDSEGRRATINYYNTTASVDGEWYVFILDEDGVMVSHPTLPDNVGQSILGPAGTDINGYNFGADMITATESGKWVDYTYLNPARDNAQERKHSWVVKRDDLIFGSGWYER